MAAAVRIYEVFEEAEKAPPLAEALLVIPSNATDNQVAAIVEAEREKAEQWEANARAHVQALIEWPNPSPGMKDLQAKTVVYLRAVGEMFAAKLTVDVQQLVAALAAPDPVVPRFAIEAIGGTILNLRIRQRTVIQELTDRLEGHLAGVLVPPAVADERQSATVPSEETAPEASVSAALVSTGALGIAASLLGVAMPFLGGGPNWAILATAGFALWWMTGEAVRNVDHGEA